LSKDKPGETAEEMLGSRGRIRVLKVMSESSELNISEVGRRTGLNYTSVERHLTKLKDMGLLREKRYGNIRIFEALFKRISISFVQNRGIEINIEEKRV